MKHLDDYTEDFYGLGESGQDGIMMDPSRNPNLDSSSRVTMSEFSSWYNDKTNEQKEIDYLNGVLEHKVEKGHALKSSSMAQTVVQAIPVITIKAIGGLSKISELSGALSSKIPILNIAGSALNLITSLYRTQRQVRSKGKIARILTLMHHFIPLELSKNLATVQGDITPKVFVDCLSYLENYPPVFKCLYWILYKYSLENSADHVLKNMARNYLPALIAVGSAVAALCATGVGAVAAPAVLGAAGLGLLAFNVSGKWSKLRSSSALVDQIIAHDKSNSGFFEKIFGVSIVELNKIKKSRSIIHTLFDYTSVGDIFRYSCGKYFFKYFRFLSQKHDTLERALSLYYANYPVLIKLYTQYIQYKDSREHAVFANDCYIKYSYMLKTYYELVIVSALWEIVKTRTNTLKIGSAVDHAREMKITQLRDSQLEAGQQRQEGRLEKINNWLFDESSRFHNGVIYQQPEIEAISIFADTIITNRE